MKFPFVKEAVTHVFQKPSTECFPAVRKEAPAGYRGRIVFNADKCTGCGMCMRVCAPDAITKTAEKLEEGERVTMTFDLGSCTFCQNCADFCAKGAIEMSGDYAMVAREENDLKVSGSFVKKPRPAAAAAKRE